MDKERARFVLGCFRPDGADAGDPDFAEALRLAAEDRELGEWLAHERARDAAFAQALGAVEIPEELRDEILTGFAAERGEMPQADDGQDAAFIGALASVRPPEGLRNEILEAMERSSVKKKVVPAWWKFGAPIAVAAAVVLAFVIFNGPRDSANGGRLSASAVEAGFIEAFASPTFQLDMSVADHQAMFDYLKSELVPCPCPATMPPGLEQVAGVGCRVLEVEGHRGSLICFDERAAGTVHMVVFFRDEVEGDWPSVSDPEFGQHGAWAVARWASADRAFVLLGATDKGKLSGLF